MVTREAYEGLVYPEYSDIVHQVDHEMLSKYLHEQLAQDALGAVEGYDYGKVSPSCYGLAFYNEIGDIFITDGFYEANVSVKKQAKMIKEIRNAWQVIPTEPIFSDPQIFKKTEAKKDSVSQSISSMFRGGRHRDAAGRECHRERHRESVKLSRRGQDASASYHAQVRCSSHLRIEQAGLVAQ